RAPHRHRWATGATRNRSPHRSSPRLAKHCDAPRRADAREDAGLLVMDEAKERAVRDLLLGDRHPAPRVEHPEAHAPVLATRKKARAVRREREPRHAARVMRERVWARARGSLHAAVAQPHDDARAASRREHRAVPRPRERADLLGVTGEARVLLPLEVE